MTKKHFNKIAKDILKLREFYHDAETIKAVMETLCDTFLECNPNFDRGRFMTACGF